MASQNTLALAALAAILTSGCVATNNSSSTPSSESSPASISSSQAVSSAISSAQPLSSIPMQSSSQEASSHNNSSAPSNPYVGLDCVAPALPYAQATGGALTLSLASSLFDRAFKITGSQDILHSVLAGQEVYQTQELAYPHYYPSKDQLEAFFDIAFSTMPIDHEAVMNCGPVDPDDSARDDRSKCGRTFTQTFDEKLKNIGEYSENEQWMAFAPYYAIFEQADSRTEAYNVVAKQMFLDGKYGPSVTGINALMEGFSVINPLDIQTKAYYSLMGRSPSAQEFADIRIGELDPLKGYYDFNSVLDTPAGVTAMVDALIGTPEHKRQVPEVLRGWLNAPYAFFSSAPGALTSLDIAKDTEINLLLAELFTGDYTLKDIFTADFTYVNAELAAFYGIEGVTTDEFVKVTVPNNLRGLLNKSGIQNTSDVLNAILCDENKGLTATTQQELIDILTTEDGQTAVAACFAKNYSYYVKIRVFEPNACEVADDVAMWRNSGKGLRELLLATYKQPYFRHSM